MAYQGAQKVQKVMVQPIVSFVLSTYNSSKAIMKSRTKWRNGFRRLFGFYLKAGLELA